MRLISMPNLLLVGGTGRNVGKTEFLCRLLNAVAAKTEVYALKVSIIYPDESLYHGDHSEEEKDFDLFEEHNTSSHKDTSRMLRAGATRVFYLRCDDTHLARGFAECLNHLPEGEAILCESNSLGGVVQPGLRIMVHNPENEIKRRAQSLLSDADLMVLSDTRSGFPELSRVDFSLQTGWHLVD